MKWRSVQENCWSKFAWISGIWNKLVAANVWRERGIHCEFSMDIVNFFPHASGAPHLLFCKYYIPTCLFSDFTSYFKNTRQLYCCSCTFHLSLLYFTHSSTWQLWETLTLNKNIAECYAWFGTLLDIIYKTDHNCVCTCLDPGTYCQMWLLWCHSHAALFADYYDTLWFVSQQ